LPLNPLTEITPDPTTRFFHTHKISCAWGELDVTDLCLNEQQYQFICGVTDGRTWEEAAEFAGVKPYNIDFWRRNSRAFQRAVEDVHYAHAFQFRRQAHRPRRPRLRHPRRFARQPQSVLHPSACAPPCSSCKTAINPPKYKPPAPADILELPYGKLMDIKESWRQQDAEEAAKRQAEKRQNLHKNAQPEPKLA
jgi:hypothetical protein